jgi:hypothetical protein
MPKKNINFTGTDSNQSKYNKKDFRDRYIGGLDKTEAKLFNLLAIRYIYMKQMIGKKVINKKHNISLTIINKLKMSDIYTGNDKSIAKKNEIALQLEANNIKDLHAKGMLDKLYTVQMKIERDAVKAFNGNIETKVKQIKEENRRKLKETIGEESYNQLSDDEKLSEINKRFPLTEEEEETFFWYLHKVKVEFKGYFPPNVKDAEEAKEAEVIDSNETARNLRG